MLKQIRTVVITLMLILLSILTAAVFINNSDGIKIEVIVHNDFGITAEAVESLDDIPVPNKTGYNFCGWYDNLDLYGERVTSLPKRGRVSLYPKWEAQTFSVTFDTNGGSPIPSVSGEYNSPLSPPEAPNKAGYTFGGWYKDGETNVLYQFDKVEAENITLYAKWTINTVMISFSGELGEDYGSKQLNYGETLGALPAPVKPGYIFDKWISSDGKTKESADIVLTSQTLYAVWTANTNTLMLEGNGGTGQTVIIRIRTDEQIEIPDNHFVREGYSFAGWSDAPEGEISYLEGGKFRSGSEGIRVLYAVWVPIFQTPVLSAEVNDITYGEPLSIKITQNTAGAAVTYNYKKLSDDVFSVIPPTEAGEYSVFLTAEGDNGSIASEAYQFIISKREISVEAGIAISQTYNGETTASVSSINYKINNLINGDDPVLSFDKAFFDSPHAGLASKVTITGLKILNQNYFLAGNALEIPATILPKTVKVYAEGKNKVYGENDPELTYFADGIIEKDELPGALIRAAGESVGVYEISGAFFNNDYDIEIISASLVITPRPIAVTALDITKVYGERDPHLDYILEGGINGALPFGETFVGSLTRIKGEDTGSYSIMIGSFALRETKNYSLTFTGGSFVIIPAEALINTGHIPKTYQYLGFPQTISGAEAAGGGKVTYLNNSFTSAGSHKITILAEGTRNYKSGSVVFTVTVLPAELTAIYMGETIVYGESPALNINLYGFLAGDNESCLKTLPVVAATCIEAGRYELSPSEGEADNYIFRYVPGVLSIAKKPLDIIIDSQTKVFGQTDPEFTYTMGELAYPTDIFSGGLYREQGESTGSYPIYSSLENNNYSISVEIGNLKILQNRITVTQSMGGIITPDDDNETDIIYGASKVYIAIPDAGYSVTSLIADGKEVPVTAERGKEQVYVFPSVTYSASITALFSPNENLLVFDGNGSTGGGTNQQLMVTGEVSFINPNGYIKNGYIFIGWSESANGNIAYTDGAAYLMGAEDEYVLYANWAAIVRDSDNTGGENLSADILGGTDIEFYGELDVCVLPEEDAGYWLAADIMFPAGVPVYEAQILGDDGLRFSIIEGNSLRVYLNVREEQIGRELKLEIKWNAISNLTAFKIKISETLAFAKLVLTGLTVQTLDGETVYPDAETRSLTLSDGATIVQITAEFNKNISAKYDGGIFGFGEGNQFTVIIQDNVAQFTSSFTAAEGEYLFVGYSPLGEAEAVFPLTDATGMINLERLELFSLTVLPPEAPLPFGVTDIQATITNSYKTQSYQDGGLFLNSKANVSQIQITLNEVYIMGSNYKFATFSSDQGEITAFSFVQTGNILIIYMDAGIAFSPGIHQLKFINSRNAPIAVPLTGTESGQAFPGTVLITVYAS